MNIARLLLVLALALGFSAEAQSSRSSRKKSSTAATKTPKKSKKSTRAAPAAPAAEPAAEPAPEPAPGPAVAAPEAPPAPPAPVLAPSPLAGATVVLAAARTPAAQESAARIQEELGRLLGARPEVQLVDLAAAFPPPPPASLQEADALFEEGKNLYDNLDPEAAVGKFLSAVEAYEKHPAELNPERLARSFIFLGASQLLNGDKEAARLAFTRALAASPSTQPESALFGTDVQTAFTDAQQAFHAQPKGTLSIDSQPSGARVTMRGQELGLTPLKNVEVHAGRHPVVISLPGYVPYASYPQVAPSKSAEVKPQLEPLPGLATVHAAAARATTERAFKGSALPSDVAAIGEQLGARYVVLAAVSKPKRDPAEAELQVWDVRTKNRLRGVELELQTKDRERTMAAAADRVHAFLTGRALPDSSSPSQVSQVIKKPWFWAAVAGGAAVVTGGILLATQDRPRPGDVVTGLPGVGF